MRCVNMKSVCGVECYTEVIVRGSFFSDEDVRCSSGDEEDVVVSHLKVVTVEGSLDSCALAG